MKELLPYLIAGVCTAIVAYFAMRKSIKKEPETQVPQVPPEPIKTEPKPPEPIKVETPKVETPKPPEGPGKGPYIWVEDELAFENVIEPGYLDDMVRAGITRVYLKIMDDQGGDKLWAQAQKIPQFVARGIQVFGWAYHFNGKYKPNIALVVENVNKCIALGMTGYVYDVEVELENSQENLVQFLALARAVKDGAKGVLTIGFCPIGNPQGHPGFPYKAICDSGLVDFLQPQEYYDHWKGSDAAVEKMVQDDIDYFRTKLGIKIPIYCLFSAEPGAPYPRSKEFHQYMLEKYIGASMWRWPHKGENIWVDKLNYGGKPKPTTTPTVPVASVNKRLFNFYNNKENYLRVYDNVVSWFSATRPTYNGCVAFMSSALRLSGFDVPFSNGVDGYSISRVTRPFSEFLISRGWKKIINPTELQPGDVCFSQVGMLNGKPDVGYPAHTYMFVKWEKAGSTAMAYVNDNNGYNQLRNITASGPNTPFEYALRAP